MVQKLYNAAKKIVTGKAGASMREYAILLAVVTIALLAVIQAYSGAISGAFTSAQTTMHNAASGGIPDVIASVFR
jgi:Flp pilus assembly pilin Flp